MIFHEIYSAYYNTVASILSHILRGETDEKTLKDIVRHHAFGESAFAILPALRKERWQLVKSDMTTPIRHIPTMPSTMLEKRWLKAISLDPRIRLFDVTFDGLCDVEPLFTEEDYYIYDRYSDGDPYEDAGYIERFRTILSAVRDGVPIKVNMISRAGSKMYAKCRPVRLEYSEKDDKFRVITTGCRFVDTINLARILSCARCEETVPAARSRYRTRQQELTLHLVNERNALERCMLHFAHFEKRVCRAGVGQYLVHIRYDEADEMEMVIRILSFGPMIRVIEPDSLVERIRDKLRQQKSCGLSF